VEAGALADLLASWLEETFVVVDVGARWGAAERWTRFGPNVRVVGFDPDEEECARLTALEGADGRVSYVAAALGPADSTATLHVTAEPACSSLYPPDPDALRHRPELHVIRPVGTEQVRMTTLDGWWRSSGHHALDVLKLDTQGSELGVLQGGEAALAGVRLLEVEVEFNEIYAGQPLFGDVDRFLRDRGFVLWRLQHLVHYGTDEVDATATPVADEQFFDSQPVAVAGRGGQLYWGHAYFVRRELAFPGTAPSWQRAVRDAVAAVAYGFTDLALALLDRADPPRHARKALAALR
jgi:FkbM family methyltransferase